MYVIGSLSAIETPVYVHMHYLLLFVESEMNVDIDAQ